MTVCCLQIVLGLLLDRGDHVLTEEFTYPHMVDSITGPRGYQLWGVPYDDHGIIPEAMDQVRCRNLGSDACLLGHQSTTACCLTIASSTDCF